MIPLILGGLAAGMGIYNSIHQSSMAKKLNPKRPNYQIPGEVLANRQMYQDMANSQRLPGQSMAENNIRSGTANALNAITQTGGGTNNILAAISGLNKNQNDAYNNLAVQGAQMNLANKDKLANANMAVAGEKKEAFDYNKNQPYMMDLQRKMALQQAAGNNMSNAMQGMFNLSSTMFDRGYLKFGRNNGGGNGGGNPYGGDTYGAGPYGG